jgi:hypothetical protein
MGLYKQWRMVVVNPDADADADVIAQHAGPSHVIRSIIDNFQGKPYLGSFPLNRVGIESKITGQRYLLTVTEVRDNG